MGPPVTKSVGLGSLSWCGVAKGPAAAHTITHTGQHTCRPHGQQVHGTHGPFQRQVHTGAHSCLHTHFQLALLLGCPHTTPPTPSPEAEQPISTSPIALLHSPLEAPLGAGGSPGRAISQPPHLFHREKKAAASQKHPIQQNVFKYLMKE